MEFRCAMKSISPGRSETLFPRPVLWPGNAFRKIFNNGTVSQT
jgi:hypothetical protein